MSKPPSPPAPEPESEQLISAAWRVEQLASETLTDRERDTLGLVVAGASTVQAAQALKVSVSTVKGYLRGLYAKTGLHSREAVLRAAFELPTYQGAGPVPRREVTTDKVHTRADTLRTLRLLAGGA